MADDLLADDLQSMSFGSSNRSGSETVSTGSSDLSRSSAACQPPSSPVTTAAGDSLYHLIQRFGSASKKESLRPSDLRFVRKLGSGDIGSVYLAELKGSSATASGDGAPAPTRVAVKVMDKKELEERNKVGRAKTEKEILEMLDHPFLPRLYGSTENDQWLCLLTEFCPGGDLHVLRQRQPGKRFDEAAVRFYAAEVVVALEYLHMMDVVYRDLKPENVLIRSDGHIMLTDFDLSLKCVASASTTAHLISERDPLPLPHLVDLRHHPPSSGVPSAATSCIIPSCIVPTVSCFNSNWRRKKKRNKKWSGGSDMMELVAERVDVRSMSFVGTHEYLAPEVISGEGHGSAVDWWTLGVFLFELLYGVTPFRGVDHEQTMAHIVARALEFPKDPRVSQSTRDLVAGLLVKDPTSRMGSTTGAAAVKRHPFFSGVTWALLRCATPPHVPSPGAVGSSWDVSEDSSPVDYY